MVVLKRLMARGPSECVAAALEKHGEPKIMHVIQRVYAPQKAKVKSVLQTKSMMRGLAPVYTLETSPRKNEQGVHRILFWILFP